MKRPENIVIRLAVLLTILICLGLEAYSNYNMPIYSIELSAEVNIVDNGINSDVDTSDDIQIYQIPQISSISESMIRIPHSKDLFVTQRYQFSNWQPPKISDFRI